MKRLVILGAGTAGTMVANKLRRRLDLKEWAITIVDQDNAHHYQPGYLFLPFGAYKPSQIMKPRRKFIPKGVEFRIGEIDRAVPAENHVLLADGTRLPYDQLVIATGTTPRPDQTPGLLGAEWRKSVHEFYTFEGSKALAGALETWQGGRLLIHITEMPIKCPVAPLEFAFLADAYFKKKVCGTRSSWFTSRHSMAHSRARWRRGTLGGMLESGVTCSSPISPSSASMRKRRRSSPTTSASSRSTCRWRSP